MNSYGNLFKVTIYGESHSKSMGIVIDNIKSGLKVDEKSIKKLLWERTPQFVFETTRVEEDEFDITSGVFNGFTTGGAINVLISNRNINSSSYENLKYHFRPGHADFTANQKYHGFNDYRGGGFFSGRMTACLVVAGYFSSLVKEFNIETEIVQVGNCLKKEEFDSYLLRIKENNDSVGCIIKVKCTNVVIGMGEPYFCSLESEISKMMFSIPGVKAIEFGIGFKGISLLGSDFNDLIVDKFGKTKTNNNGGINGGISNGNNVEFSLFIKPTSSIAQKQSTYNFRSNVLEDLQIEGRHDSCFGKRVEIVVKSCLNIVLTDLYLLSEVRNEKN